MMPLLALSILAMTSTGPSLLQCDYGKKPTVEEVVLRKEGSGTNVTRIERARDKKWGRYDAVALVFNNDRGQLFDDHVMIASMELLVVPEPVPPELQGKDLKTYGGGWARLTSTENLQTRVLPVLKGCARNEIKTFHIDLDEIISHIADPLQFGRLWPWAIRVRFTILDRDGTMVAQGTGTIDVVPDASGDPPKAQ
jgi:hypothetical protein